MHRSKNYTNISLRRKSISQISRHVGGGSRKLLSDWVRVPVFLLMVLFLLLTTGCDNKDDMRPTEDFEIGMLLPRTGSAASAGESVEAGILLAINDVNSYMENTGNALRVKATFHDTETEPAIALERLKDLHQQGIRYVIGPYSSANCAAVLDYANQNGIVLLSPSSVASSLAIADDNLFRMAPADNNQAEAISALFAYDSVSVIIPVVRDDVWGDGLLSDLDQLTDETGLTVQSPIFYDPDNINNTAIASDVAASIAQTVLQYPVSEVAVYLLSFGEGTDILEAAAGEPDCALVNWYGSSAFAKSAGLAANNTAATFAMQQMLRCPSFAPDPDAIGLWEPFVSRLETILGREPEVYALTAGDAVWLMTYARLEQSDKTDIESFKSALVGVAANLNSLTGRMLLNEFGDRDVSFYDFWGVEPIGGTFEWKSFGQYSNTDGLTVY